MAEQLCVRVNMCDYCAEYELHRICQSNLYLAPCVAPIPRNVLCEAERRAGWRRRESWGLGKPTERCGAVCLGGCVNEGNFIGCPIIIQWLSETDVGGPIDRLSLVTSSADWDNDINGPGIRVFMDKGHP